MKLLERRTDPSPTDLKWFGVIVLSIFGLIGGLLWWRLGSLEAAWILWVIGFTAAAFYYAVPPLRRPFFAVWMTAMYPIGWTISHLAMGIVYYVALTPIGWIMRLVGRDPMERRLNRESATYWVPYTPPSDAGRYFRQF